MIKLSIIIPYYKTLNYTTDLLLELDKQITNEVEVLTIEDMTGDMFHYIKKGNIYRLEENSGEAGRTKKVGIENPKAE